MAINVPEHLYAGAKIRITMQNLSAMNKFDGVMLRAKFMRAFAIQFKMKGFRFDPTTETYAAGQGNTNLFRMTPTEISYSSDKRNIRLFKRFVAQFKIPVVRVKETPFVILSRADMASLYESNTDEIKKVLKQYYDLPKGKCIWSAYQDIHIPSSADKYVDRPTEQDVGYDVVASIQKTMMLEEIA